MMYVIEFAGGITGWEWLWLGLALVADIAFWAAGAFAGACRATRGSTRLIPT